LPLSSIDVAAVFIVLATVTVRITIIVVAIITILVVGIAGPCRWSLLCLLCALAVNPRNLTKAGQGSIAHGMGMEHLPLD
jgi:hypothetical protein